MILAPLAGILSLALAACASSFDILPEKMGGLPDSAPARPTDTPAFPNVYEVRPTREAKPLNGEEQKKLESELVSVREQQKQLANPPPPPPPPAPPAKPPAAKKTASKTPTKPAASAAKPAAPAAGAPTKQKDAVVPDSGSAPLKPIN